MSLSAVFKYRAEQTVDCRVMIINVNGRVLSTCNVYVLIKTSYLLTDLLTQDGICLWRNERYNALVTYTQLV